MTKAYFLQGERYLRYDVEADQIDSGYPKQIAVGLDRARRPWV